MDTALEMLRQAGWAAVQLLISPFYYAALIVIALQYGRQTVLERRLFHVRLHGWQSQLLRSVLAGFAVGLAMSAAGLFLGISVTGEAVLWMWGAAALLALVRVRFLCFAYGTGLLGVLQWALGWTALAQRGDWLGTAAASLARLDIAGLLLLAALMHLAEALLVRRQGARFASPLFLAGKRGKLIGAYALQGFWPVPLLLLVPAAAGSGAETALPWPTLLGGGFTQQGAWTMIGFPVVIGFSELTRTMLPEMKARGVSALLALYGAVLAGAAALAAFWPPFLLAAALLAPLLHEGIMLTGRLLEAGRSPRFTHDERGLCVLAVIPGTPAEAMGLQAGEILQKVNGVRVGTKEELHAALHVNSAFCRLEVMNLEGQVKFVQRARYAGEHHQLGVVLAPDEKANYYAAARNLSLIGLLRRGRAARKRETPSTM
nr:PDZ domain-containing protein [Paenibacillus humicola]